ncbi:Iaa16p [Stylosanthes scabra]|uniref:Auxin-induced protein n=1 Tax=Stylosanthes scabra TaxID=79078 RepID=A0ABU6QSU7_9FABA|nr:Iaa16p [Stylosanthes scabra]
MESERDKYSMINFEETELRLGLPGGSNDGELSLRNTCTTTATGKRGFSETTAATNVDLKLNLNLASSSCSSSLNNNNDSVSISSVNADSKNKEKNGSASTPTSTPPVTRSNDPAKPPAKAQVVGWPPVRSFRKNIVSSGQKSNKEETEKVAVTAATTSTAVAPSAAATSGTSGGAYVKVSVEGAPYLRKVDLKQYKSYRELSDALAKMFSATIIDSAGSGAQSQAQHDGKGNGLFTFNGSDYVPTYEDKDGDWMLVGDVPWEMFVESCKRLRIVKGSEAIGLGVTPRAAAAEEKCKIRS